MVPVFPGSTWRDHSPAVVQPQEGCTLVRMSNSSPVLVKIKVYFTGSPDLTFPKSYTGVANTIFGPVAAVAAWSAADTVPATLAKAIETPKINLAVILFIFRRSLSQITRRLKSNFLREYSGT